MQLTHLVVLGFMLSLFIPHDATAKPFTAMYVIGDSLSDQGNLFNATETLTGLGLPAADHYYQGRFSNGEVCAGFLAERMGLGLAATAIGGTNYAYGGARTEYNVVENPPTEGGFLPGLYPWTLDLERQAFAADGVNDPRGLYVLFSGSNDLADLIGFALVSGFDAASAAVDGVIQGAEEIIEAYVAAGARDILVPNVPDMGLVPHVAGMDPLPGMPADSTLVSDTATALSVRYNTALDEMLMQFNGVNIIRFDTFSLVRKMTNNPAAYGLTNVTAPCYTGFVDPARPNDTVCSTPETYLFWDYEHPTTTVHALLAERMLAALANGLLRDFAREVGSMDLDRSEADSLRTVIANARNLLADGKEQNDGAVLVLLHAFTVKVEALRGILIPAEEADALLARARQITELVEAMERS